MDKIEALENIKSKWNDTEISLKDKIISISTAYYSAGLDLMHTSSYIKATPSELESLLALSGLEDEFINQISVVNPPKTTWAFFANGSAEEIENAIKNFANRDDKPDLYSEFVYKSMTDVSGPSVENKVDLFTATEIKNIRIKGENYQKLTDKESKFLKSIASTKAKPNSKGLSSKQLSWLISILNSLVDNNVFTRNSIDDDQDLCDKVLNALGR